MAILALALLWPAPAALADVWDLGGDNDNTSGSDNEITHGLDQVHDMAAQQGGTVEDVDWYRFQTPYNTSWEIVLDGMTGQISDGTMATAVLQVIASDGTTNNYTGTPLTSFGIARHLTWYNVGVAPDDTRYVRVSGPACALACTADDRYRIRAYETTLLLPRFNNSNGQVTVLVLQNGSGDTIDGHGRAMGAGGVMFGTFVFTLQPYEVVTYNLATISDGAFDNHAGALRIVHKAGYGQLTGKAVALEPATGFTFDTPVVHRPR